MYHCASVFMPTIVVYLDNVVACVSQKWHLPSEHTNAMPIRLCGYRFVADSDSDSDNHPSLQNRCVQRGQLVKRNGISRGICYSMSCVIFK